MPYSYTYDGPKADKSTVDAGLNRNLVASYTMLTDDPAMDADLASLQFTADKAIGIGDAHPTNANAYCSQISCSFHQGSVLPNRKFDIELTYTTTPDSGGAGSAQYAGSAAPAVASQQQGVAPSARVDAPLSRGWDLKTSGGTRKVSIYADRFSLPFKNGLGDPMFPPMTRDAPTMKAKLSINRATRYDNHYNYQGYVNNATVTIPGMTRSFNSDGLKLMNVSIEPVYENGVSYFRHDYDIESGPNWTWDFSTYLGWAIQVPNVGKRAKVGQPITLTATLSGGSPTITVPTNSVPNGAAVSGTGIPTGTTVLSGGGTTSIVLSANVTATGSYSLVFAPLILPITDSGVLVSEPQYLDANGYRLPQGFANSSIDWISRYPDPAFDMTILWT